IALRVNELISGIKSDLAIKVFGPDLDILRETAGRIADRIAGSVRGAEDVGVEQVAGLPHIEIIPDRRAIARFGVNVDAIGDLIEIAVGGKVATTVFEDEKRFAALVRFPERFRGDIAALERLLIPTPDGEIVALGRVAEIREVEAPAQIGREQGARRIAVESNVRGRDLGGFIADVEAAVEPIARELPPGYRLSFGGQFENQRRAMFRLAIVVPAAVLLIFLMLFSAFGSLKSSLLVMANLPFAVVGGILTLHFLEIPLSVPASIGFIALFGMAVQDGTVLVSFFDRYRSEGLSAPAAVQKACSVRFPSVVMTTLTTLLGLAPMLLATGSGSEIQAPLAAVVLGGLTSALLLVLVVLPAIYCLVHREGGPASAARRRRRWPTARRS
ncbi:MAG: efflux RND transporter permease subunit, partial [Planctomycetes bacterium]|nr:efflux RND transporter permease subunit [Planctomycetota bacterium]